MRLRVCIIARLMPYSVIARLMLYTAIARLMLYTVIARRALPDVAIPSLYFVILSNAKDLRDITAIERQHSPRDSSLRSE